MDPSTAPAPNATISKRPSAWWGVGITLVGWIILAFPAFVTLFLTAASFSGCFLECTKPEPATGVAGMIILAAMVVCPPMLGVAVVRRSRKWWIALGVCAIVVVAGIVIAAL